METQIDRTDIDVIRSLDKINLEPGNVLIFTLRTGEDGEFLSPIERIQEIYDQVEEVIVDKSVTVLFIPDTMFYTKYENADAAIHNLENVIYFLKGGER